MNKKFTFLSWKWGLFFVKKGNPIFSIKLGQRLPKSQLPLDAFFKGFNNGKILLRHWSFGGTGEVGKLHGGGGEIWISHLLIERVSFLVGNREETLFLLEG